MRAFVYSRPASLDEARRLALEGGAMLLAGGQTLLRDMKHSRHSPASLIDITSVVPSRIELHDDAITIGAGATHAEVARSVCLRGRLPGPAGLGGHIWRPARSPSGNPRRRARDQRTGGRLSRRLHRTRHDGAHDKA